MKKFLLTSTLALTMLVSLGQERPQTLLGDGVQFTSGFGGFMIGFTPVEGNIKAMSGGGGAILINNAFYLGGYGMGMAEDLVVESNSIDYAVDYSHGGLMLGFVVLPSRMTHLGLSSKIGWGEITFNEYNSRGTGFVGGRITDNVFILNPQAELEVNMTSWFKINANVGYQLANGVNNFYYTGNDFNGATFGLSFLFGWFQ
jgi:hypothetical protein